MLTLLKKIITTIMVLVMLTEPFVAQAVNLDAAFNSLLGQGTAVSVNSPGRFQSGSRNTFTAGGFDMRIPRVNASPSVFSFTPPSVAIGCNGISAHFGGLSFISGKEFEQMIKQIGTGVIVGFVVQMAIKVTCPMCEDIINKLRQAAELAAKFAVDGCNAGMAIGAKLADSAYASMTSPSDPDKSNEKQENVKNKCANGNVSVGSASDMLEALTSNCKDLSTAYNYLVKSAKQLAGLAADDNTPQGQAIEGQEKCKAGYGNMTWDSLAALDANNAESLAVSNGNFTSSSMERKLLFMNLMGVNIAPPPDGKVVSCEDGGTKYEGFCSPRISQDDAKKLMAYIMCGTREISADDKKYASIANFCNGYKDDVKTTAESFKANTKVFTCLNTLADGSSSPYSQKEIDEHCPVVGLANFEDVFKGMDNGYAFKVRDLLEYGLQKIVKDESFFGEKGSLTPKDQQLLNLINMAPFPLYQALNVAAVYPAAVNDLLDMLSLLVAQQLAISQLEDLLRVYSRSGTAKGCYKLNPERIFIMASSTRANAEKFASEIGKNFTLQQTIIEQIRALNITIQKQVLSADMLNSAKFAQNVTGVLPNVQAK